MNLRQLKLLGLLLTFSIGISASSQGQGQGVSCPAVTAGPDTSIACNGNSCVRLRSEAVSGFTTTSYIAQQIPYTPYPYNQGTPILLNIDDTWSAILNIGFDFCFYGNTYNQCLIGSNGLISFDLSQANLYCQWPISDPIPSVNNPINSIMGPFHDIDPSIAGTIRYASYGTAPCRVFVVSFEDCAMFSCNNLIATQQIVLYETTNIVETYIEDKPTCAGWNDGAAIHGVQDITGTIATAVPGRNFPTQWTAQNDAWAFVPNGAQNYTLNWYEVGNPTPIASTDTFTVCPTASTDYYAEVIYTNCNGATVTERDTASITIQGNSNLQVQVTGSNPACASSNDGSANVAISGATGNVSIQWNTGDSTTTILNLSPGSYTVTVTDGSGCGISQAITLTAPPGITVQQSQTEVNCAGGSDGSATVVASGGSGSFSYAWSNGATTSSISNLVAGNYAVTITDQNNCSATANFAITQPVPLQPTLHLTHIVCNGSNDGAISVTILGGVAPYSYTWSNGSNFPTLSNLAPGNYSLTLTDANGCTATANGDILEAAPMSVDVVGDVQVCLGETATFDAVVQGGQAPFTYLWFSRPTNISGTGPSVSDQPTGHVGYYVHVTDSLGCLRVDSATIEVLPLPEVAFTGAPLHGCDTMKVNFTNQTQGAVAYEWNFGHGQPSTDPNPSHLYPLGDFSVTLTATSVEGCTSHHTEYLYVDVIPSPIAQVHSEPDITLYDYFLLSEADFMFWNSSLGGVQHLWDFGNGDSIWSGAQVQYIYPDTGSFTISYTTWNEYGCPASVWLPIRILQDPFLWVPNAFTPGDGDLNDLFQVVGLMVEEYEIWIFDRWGKLIFNSQDISDSWDGTYAGVDLAEGVYTWKIIARNNLNETFTRAGTVTMIR